MPQRDWTFLACGCFTFLILIAILWAGTILLFCLLALVSPKLYKGFCLLSTVTNAIALYAELINAYDNTLVYTDYFLAQTFGILKNLQDTACLMIYISDHGESLGEHGLYLHGLPFAIAPEEQKQIPFLVWMSESFIQSKNVDLEKLNAQPRHSQKDIFHSVMGSLFITSVIYQK